MGSILLTQAYEKAAINLSLYKLWVREYQMWPGYRLGHDGVGMRITVHYRDSGIYCIPKGTSSRFHNLSRLPGLSKDTLGVSQVSVELAG